MNLFVIISLNIWMKEKTESVFIYEHKNEINFF